MHRSILGIKRTKRRVGGSVAEWWSPCSQFHHHLARVHALHSVRMIVRSECSPSRNAAWCLSQKDNLDHKRSRPVPNMFSHSGFVKTVLCVC